MKRHVFVKIANAQKLYFRFVKVWTLVPTPSIPLGPPFLIPYYIYISCVQAQSRQSAKLFLQSSELGLPQPITAGEYASLPLVPGGGAHSQARKGVGESLFRRGDTHCGTLCVQVFRSHKSDLSQDIDIQDT
jgi:hypothetical protein